MRSKFVDIWKGRLGFPRASVRNGYIPGISPSSSTTTLHHQDKLGADPQDATITLITAMTQSPQPGPSTMSTPRTHHGRQVNNAHVATAAELSVPIPTITSPQRASSCKALLQQYPTATSRRTRENSVHSPDRSPFLTWPWPARGQRSPAPRDQRALQTRATFRGAEGSPPTGHRRECRRRCTRECRDIFCGFIARSAVRRISACLPEVEMETMQNVA